MYEIIFNPTTGVYRVSCEIQDGTERWTANDRGEAYSSLISAARTLNGTYITREDIKFIVSRDGQPVPASEDMVLLDQIKRGYKVVLDAECEAVLRAREDHNSY